jgi:hypothetical protein
MQIIPANIVESGRTLSLIVSGIYKAINWRREYENYLPILRVGDNKT